MSHYSKLTVADVHYLIQRQAEGISARVMPAEELAALLTLPDSLAVAEGQRMQVTTGSSILDVPNLTANTRQPPARYAEAHGWGAPPGNREGLRSGARPAPQHSIHTNSSAADVLSFCNNNPSSVLIPFPVLSLSEVNILTSVAASEECGMSQRRKTTRILQSLSLADTNWHMLLSRLGECGAQLAAATVGEIHTLHGMLQRVVTESGDASYAMSQPALATPSSVSELRLLHVLRLMMGLRSAKPGVKSGTREDIADESALGEDNAQRCALVNDHIARIDFGDLWDRMCDCLDLVRGLEGIVEEDDEDSQAPADQGAGGGSNSSNKTKKKKTATALSSLTMRFVPLVECYLTVSSTFLTAATTAATAVAANANAVTSNTSQQLPSVGVTPSTKRDRDGNQVLAVSGTPKIGTMPLPGARFRKSSEFLSMQVDLPHDASALHLYRFTKKNHILLNMILKNNIHLLESSFAPLINLQRCRCLLAFDVKLGYFKMKLRRLRQSIQRNHGSLRISVRRRDVFLDSFEQLRYKTTEEMRRRLVVSFVGEEGLDAGGLTREWYSVLAREIFNPNYGLFIGTGDTVTFQPNPASGTINPDWHLQYFKLVGRVIGKAICDGHLLDAHFTRSFYKHILGLPVTVLDLEAIEPEYYRRLKMIEDVPLNDLALDLTFTAESNDFGEVKVVDLIPDGKNVEVTDSNKSEYIKLISHHRMTSAIKTQVSFYCPPNLPDLFLGLFASLGILTMTKQTPSSV